MTSKFEESFKLFNCDCEITFSIFDDRLLFIHSPFTSSQLILNEMGVNLLPQESCLQLQFYLKGGENYLSLMFRTDQAEGLYKYFLRLGYPMPDYERLTDLIKH